MASTHRLTRKVEKNGNVRYYYYDYEQKKPGLNVIERKVKDYYGLGCSTLTHVNTNTDARLWDRSVGFRWCDVYSFIVYKPKEDPEQPPRFKSGDAVREKEAPFDIGTIQSKHPIHNNWWVLWQTGNQAGRSLHIREDAIDKIEGGIIATRKTDEETVEEAIKLLKSKGYKVYKEM